MFLIILIITLLLLLILVHGIYVKDDNIIAPAIALLFLTGIFGWIMLGCLVTVKSIKSEVVATVLHDKNAAHLSVTNTIIKTFTDVATFNYLSDKETVNVIKTQTYNMYGGENMDPKWELSNTQ